jgi:hypothetical protein
MFFPNRGESDEAIDLSIIFRIKFFLRKFSPPILSVNISIFASILSNFLRIFSREAGGHRIVRHATGSAWPERGTVGALAAYGVVISA